MARAGRRPGHLQAVLDDPEIRSPEYPYGRLPSSRRPRIPGRRAAHCWPSPAPGDNPHTSPRSARLRCESAPARRDSARPGSRNAPPPNCPGPVPGTPTSTRQCARRPRRCMTPCQATAMPASSMAAGRTAATTHHRDDFAIDHLRRISAEPTIGPNISHLSRSSRQATPDPEPALARRLTGRCRRSVAHALAISAAPARTPACSVLCAAVLGHLRCAAGSWRFSAAIALYCVTSRSQCPTIDARPPLDGPPARYVRAITSCWTALSTAAVASASYAWAIAS